MSELTTGFVAFIRAKNSRSENGSVPLVIRETGIKTAIHGKKENIVHTW